MTTVVPLSAEQKLARIIEAQVKGGRDGYSRFLQGDWSLHNGNIMETIGLPLPIMTAHVLEILLDPAGLRAAYGSGPCHSMDPTPAYYDKAKRILTAWLSKPEGNPIAAIDTAFSLLP